MPQLEANIPVKSDNQQWQLDKPINHGAKKKEVNLSFISSTMSILWQAIFKHIK